MLDFSQVVTSRQNPTVKRICALSEKKKRYEQELFRFDGIKLFEEAVKNGLHIEYAVVRESESEICERVDFLVRSGTIRREAVLIVSEAVFEKITEEKAPEGIITVARFVENIRSVKDISKICVSGDERILIAESLRDAGNLGTVIRSCAALGIDRLILTDDCADVYSPKTVRAAMGGLFRLKTDICERSALPMLIKALRSGGRAVYAAALRENARVLGETKLEGSFCFVIGNEGHGLSDGVIGACDDCVIIPMSEGSESLNAAAAAAICIWETVRLVKKS